MIAALLATGTLAPAFAQQDPLVLDAVSVTAERESDVTEGSDSYTTRNSRTATKLNLSPRETPQTVSVTTRTKMDDFALNDINDVLENTNGVNVERVETDRTYFTARGFDITNFQVDGIGVPLTYGNVMGDLDTALFDKVEVLKGANGLMSGAGSPAATVNFVRKRPTEEFQASAKAGIGSWEYRRLDGDISGALNERVRARLVVAGQDKHSYLDRYEQQRGLAYGVLEVDLTDSTLLTLGHSYQQNNADSPLWGSLPLFYTDGSRTDYSRSDSSAADWAYWNNEDNRSFVELTQELGNGWTAKAAYSHLEIESDSELFYVYGTPERGTNTGVFSWPSQYDFSTRQDLVDLYASGPFQLAGREHELVAGTSWSMAKTRDHSWYGDTLGSPVPDLHGWDGSYPRPNFTSDGGGSDWTDKQQSAYVATRFSLTDDLSLLAGARLSNWDSHGTSYGKDKATRHDNVLVPYAGLVYDLTPNYSLYASYTEIFTPQVATDIDGNRLDPIEGSSMETGVKGEWLDGKLYANLALFRIEQSNLAEPIAGTTPTAYRAMDGVSSQGVELELAGELLPGWEASAGYSYVDIEDSEGNTTKTYTPRQSAKLATTYQLPMMEQLKLGANVKWQDDSYRDYGSGLVARQDAYALLGLMAKYEFTPRLDATLNIDNLTDEKYLTSFYWTSPQGYYGEPRNAKLSVNWKF
ncbi:outer membrane receptor for ferric coprogen and ferric-rhodotorulic acid [Oceanimonas sp. GK1]|uniref:TonB-dependent siderophore receptor n=1 Tax=Oceanimonas sp. (strain GK1 / IBRC-M 10197) TaxID=511062 RepID=UPI000249540D|nr:TonB-dependent siderophore receptor [Oceanimonas sp. GK1]AEY01019.1 outer membrane receptor for ferric coprogen and ferric-rhodotorulic acid [Oceanimonas sp. GK1]